MFLKDYIPKVNKKYRKVFFSGISFDSTKVKKNHIFFAITGNNFDGNKYINSAIRNGAKIIISDKKNIKKKENKFFCVSFPNIKAKICFSCNVG